MADQCYFGTGLNADFYQCATAASAGQTPLTHASKWRKLKLLAKWRFVLAQLTYANLLRLDGQTDKATVERNAAYGRESIGLDDLARAEAMEEEKQRHHARPGMAGPRGGRGGYVAAGVVLDDAYRLIGWDTTQLDSDEKASARMALSQALQEVWERWWWHELMICQQMVFAESVTNFADYSPGETVYSPVSDKYYTCLKIVGTPLTPGTDVAPRWEEYVPGRSALPAWQAPREYDSLEQFNYAGVDYQAIADGAAAGTIPPNDTTNFAPLQNWHPQVPYTTPAFGLGYQQTGNGAQSVGPFGPIRSVSQFDPRSACNPIFFQLDPQLGVTRILDVMVTHPWVYAKRVTPILTGDAYDSAASYEAAATETLVFDS